MPTRFRSTHITTSNPAFASSNPFILNRSFIGVSSTPANVIELALEERFSVSVACVLLCNDRPRGVRVDVVSRLRGLGNGQIEGRVCT